MTDQPVNPIQAFARTYMPLVNELPKERFREIDKAWADCGTYMRSLGGMLAEVLAAHADELDADLRSRIVAALEVAFLPVDKNSHEFLPAGVSEVLTQYVERG